MHLFIIDQRSESIGIEAESRGIRVLLTLQEMH